MRPHAAFCLLLLAFDLRAAEPLRVAVVRNAAPMSYVTESGHLTGFNVELARALCEAIEQRCELVQLPFNDVLPAMVRHQLDFAVVGLLMTPERRKQVLFTRPVYRSLSVWLAAQPFPGAQPPAPTVAVVQGSMQLAYGQARGWPMRPLATHADVADALASGELRAALLPMTNAVNVISDKRFAQTGLRYTLVTEPALSGDVSIGVSTAQPQLVERLDKAIDTIRRNGRFDRINTEFLPFRLQ